MDAKVLALVVTLVALAISVVSVSCSVYAYVQVLPVVGWYEQAYSAADAEQMAQWLGNLLAEMERIGMTHGHYALIFKSPHNDVSLDRQVFTALRERCLEVQKYPKGSMDYAESLEDIRRQMDKTDFDPWWWYMCNRFTVVAWLLAFACLPLLLAALILWVLYVVLYV